jgi:hypothetical protein
MRGRAPHRGQFEARMEIRYIADTPTFMRDLPMSTKRSGVVTDIRKSWALESIRAPDPLGASAASATQAASAALAVSVALLRALRDRGLLSAGEIDDLFGEAAERLQEASALKLLNRLRDEVEHKEEE